MVATIFIKELEQEAVELIKTLDKSGFVFTVAALMKDEDEDYWQLVLGVPEIRVKGMRGALIQINNIIDEEELEISLSDIKLVDDQDDIFTLLRRDYTTGFEISRAGLIGNYFNGKRIPDSIIYRVN